MLKILPKYEGQRLYVFERPESFFESSLKAVCMGAAGQWMLNKQELKWKTKTKEEGGWCADVKDKNLFTLKCCLTDIGGAQFWLYDVAWRIFHLPVGKWR